MRDWTHQCHKTVIRTKRIYFTLKDESFKISVQDERIEYLRILQLSSKQEETDRKMLLAPNCTCNRGVESITTHTIIESRIIIKIVSGKYERMLNVTESSLDKNLIRKFAKSKV